jgi:hypothetical protein
MKSIAIHDLDERNVLAFDLHELLDASGPSASSAAWRVRGPVSYIADVDIPCLDIPDRNTGPWMAGTAFRLEIEHLGHTIDGVFEARLGSSNPGQERWIDSRAIAPARVTGVEVDRCGGFVLASD